MFTKFKGSAYEKACLKAYKDLKGRQKTYDDDFKRIKPKLSSFTEKQIDSMIKDRSKEVAAILKAWRGATDPSDAYRQQVGLEFKKEMKKIIQLEKQIAAQKSNLKRELDDELDDCKMVYQGAGGIKTVYSMVHHSAEQILEMLTAHRKKM